MDSLVILTQASHDGMSFDVIIGKLDVSSLEEAEHTDHFEMTIWRRATKVPAEMLKERIEDVASPFLQKLVNDLERELRQRRQERMK